MPGVPSAEGILDITDHDPDEAGTAGAHAAGKFVRPVLESGHSLLAGFRPERFSP